MDSGEGSQAQRYYRAALAADGGERWARLLDLCLGRAQRLEVAVPAEERRFPRALQPLMPFCARRYASRWRWQCCQQRPVHFLQFSLSAEVRIFVRSVPRLLDWGYDLPEDPAFYLEGRALLWSISHEAHAFLLLSPAEAQSMRRQGWEFRLDFPDDPPTRPGEL